VALAQVSMGDQDQDRSFSLHRNVFLCCHFVAPFPRFWRPIRAWTWSFRIFLRSLASFVAGLRGVRCFLCGMACNLSPS
jgi:hypothetical protein